MKVYPIEKTLIWVILKDPEDDAYQPCIVFNGCYRSTIILFCFEISLTSEDFISLGTKAHIFGARYTRNSIPFFREILYLQITYV